MRNDFDVLQISDMDRSNDMMLADSPVQVSLTPPPNLKVEKIVFPSPSFSGEDLNLMPVAPAPVDPSMQIWGVMG